MRKEAVYLSPPVMKPLEKRPAAIAASIGPATPADEAAIGALLRDAELPSEDFVPHLAHFLVARDERGIIIGAIGAEVYASDALLRSFVVTPAERGSGLGGRLFDALERKAEAWGVARWWLLTTTAEEFFTRRGFQAWSRSNVPAAIAATREFAELCPSAACFTRERRSS